MNEFITNVFRFLGRIVETDDHKKAREHARLREQLPGIISDRDYAREKELEMMRNGHPMTAVKFRNDYNVACSRLSIIEKELEGIELEPLGI